MLRWQMKTIAVVDLFAGPGGLSEGFAAWKQDGVKFDIRLSVEKDRIACRTLRLRKFFRSINSQKVRDSYYAYLRGEVGTQEDLAKLWPTQWAEATKSVLELTLGAEDLDQGKLEARIFEAGSSANSWILIGGPPCQAYSVVGRSRMRGENPERFLRDHRHTLYKEYLRILAKFSPPMFVMENVKGLLSSRLGDGTAFEQIEKDLRDPQAAMGGQGGEGYDILPVVQYESRALCGPTYAPSEYIVRSELHGVPQARHRVILVGVRKNLPGRAWLKPLDLAEGPITVDAAIGDLPPLRSRLSGEVDSYETWTSVVREAIEYCAKRGLVSPDAKQLTDAPPEHEPSRKRFREWDRKPQALADWLHDPDLQGVINHETRSHIREDLARYVFVAAFAEKYGKSPKLDEFPKALLPQHRNVRDRKAGDAIPFSDRFRAQRRDAPATTVTSHISKDGHYFIHPDILQCRSLTVREAARLQTFPDNYFFEGNQTQQYHQVGNAVPPYLAHQIAGAVARKLVRSGEIQPFDVRRVRK